MAATPQVIDHGRLQERELKTPISVTITLALPRLAEVERLQQAIYTPGAPEYHQFLTGEQFVSRFAPTDQEVATVVGALGKYGLHAEKTTATTLKVTGMLPDLERAFSTTLHKYEVPGHDNVPGYTYHAPAAGFTLPAEISKHVRAVYGLDNRPAFHPNVKKGPKGLHAAPGSTTMAKTGNAFGDLTVADFAANYDIDPLYSAGVTGSGRTIGIITLAGFTPSDAYAYWGALGLNVSPTRISVVNIDGGPGAPSDAAGSDETTLDVEQAGGVAPGAKIIVYQGPNTNQAFVDLFAAAVEANTADSISTSWGEWEWFDNLDNSPVTDPLGGGTVASTQAIHELLLRASIQGQTAFAASGDSGAYDVNGDVPCSIPYSPSTPFSCSLTLSVDYPASDTMITAGGGTTLAGHQSYCLNAACTPPYSQVQIPQESVWGWDYLNGLCARLGFDPVSCGTFPGGSGGGVSVSFAKPAYQAGVSGTQLSQSGQAFYLQPYGLLYALPSSFAGRNVPDISFNADPQTGYVVVYTSSVNGFGVLSFIGGTSFVAPQLNGVAALLDQYVGKRVGFLNPTLYGLLNGKAYNGKSAPLNNVSFGDNWFYNGTKGYNLGSGLGTLDVFNFAQYLKSQF
jgi:subtilase family serine protease